eukprot:3658719-Rhodomonas_salina.1
MRWLREAELKHGRVCMLAATGMIVQDVYQFPGVTKSFGDAKMTTLHDVAVKQGSMQQLLVWLGFLEIFGFVAIVQMLQVRPFPTQRDVLLFAVCWLERARMLPI